MNELLSKITSVEDAEVWMQTVFKKYPTAFGYLEQAFMKLLKPKI